MPNPGVKFDYRGNPIAPKNYLTESLLATLFCCLPLGVVGLINASKVESLYNQGRYAEAQKASADAWKWTRYSFVAALICCILAFVFYFIVPLLYVLVVMIYVLVMGASIG